jgi:hypothetical protein
MKDILSLVPNESPWSGPEIKVISVETADVFPMCLGVKVVVSKQKSIVAFAVRSPNLHFGVVFTDPNYLS